MKTNNNNKVMTGKKGNKRGKSAPVVESAPVVLNGVSVLKGSGELVMGSPINSKRVTPGAEIKTYRVVPSQRKTDNARYYVQGGFNRVDPQTQRDHFVVSVEIPHTDLYTAKLQMVSLNADLKSALERIA